MDGRGNWFQEHIKWIGIGISVILLIVLAVLLIDNQREAEAKKGLEIELEEKTVPYMKEISDIQNAIAVKKKELEEKGKGSLVSSAFVVSSVKEAEKVKELTAKTTMPLSIVLNDTMEVQEVREVLEILDSRSYHIILTGNSLEEEGWQKVDETRALLPELGCQDQPGFLLLIKEDGEKNLESLNERGYTTILRYRKDLDSGKTEQNQDFFPYSVIKEPDVTEERLDKILKKSANMFFLFHLGAIEEGLITEEEMVGAIALIETYGREGKIQIMNFADMHEALESQLEKKETLGQEFEAYEAEQNKRIEELERAVDEIYSE